MTTALTVTKPTGREVVFTAAQEAIVREMMLPGLDQLQADYFLEVCRVRRLNPLAKQIHPVIHMVKKKGSNEREPRLTIITGVDGFRLNSSRSGEYEGQTSPEWCGDDSIWRDVWLEDEPPKAARVGVYRRGFREAVYGVVTWKSYAQYVPRWENGQQVGSKLSEMWDRSGPEQLAKCAEAQAHRKAFPEECSDMFEAAEMGVVERVVSAEDERRASPRIPEQPKRLAPAAKKKPKSAATIQRDQPEQEPFAAAEAIDGEVVAEGGLPSETGQSASEARAEPGSLNSGQAPFGEFWNGLVSRKLGPMPDVYAAIGIDANMQALRAWYTENGESLELLDYVQEAVAAAKGE